MLWVVPSAVKVFKHGELAEFDDDMELFQTHSLHTFFSFFLNLGASTPMMATSPRRNFSSQTIPPPPGDPSKNPYTTSKAESISEISLICTFCTCLHSLFQSHRSQNSFQLLQLRRLGYEMRKGPLVNFTRKWTLFSSAIRR